MGYFAVSVSNATLPSLFMAFCFRWSITCRYFSVIFMLACPRSEDTVFMSVPAFRRFTAKLCRAQCHVMLFFIPAFFTHRARCFLAVPLWGRSNILSLGLSSSLGCPISFISSSLSGVTTAACALRPALFFWLNLITMLS